MTEKPKVLPRRYARPSAFMAVTEKRRNNTESRRITSQKNGLEICGFSREITMIDYGITNDMEKFVTEISVPVARCGQS